MDCSFSRWRYAIGMMVVGWLATSVSARGQTSGDSTAYRRRVLGVFDIGTGEPIENADVVDIMAKVTARTTATGTVSLSFLPVGTSMIRIQRLGYMTATTVVNIAPDDTLPLTVLLSPSTQRLPGVTTTDSASNYFSVGLKAFEERSRNKALSGQFFGEKEFRKYDGMNLTSLARKLSGMTVECKTVPYTTCQAVATRVRSRFALLGGQCLVQLYIDGQMQPDENTNLEMIKVQDYAALEYYAGANVPTIYNRTGSTCGVLLLWSRER